MKPLIKYILTSLIFLVPLTSCNKDPYSQGFLKIINKSGEAVFIETNLKSMEGNSQTAFSMNSGNVMVLCSSASINNSVSDMKIDDICTNFTEGFVTLYKLDSSGNKIKCREWSYAERNNTGRQFFSTTYLKFQTRKFTECCKNYTANQYVFTILPEDLK